MLTTLSTYTKYVKKPTGSLPERNVTATLTLFSHSPKTAVLLNAWTATLKMCPAPLNPADTLGYVQDMPPADLENRIYGLLFRLRTDNASTHALLLRSQELDKARSDPFHKDRGTFWAREFPENQPCGVVFWGYTQRRNRDFDLASLNRNPWVDLAGSVQVLMHYAVEEHHDHPVPHTRKLEHGGPPSLLAA